MKTFIRRFRLLFLLPLILALTVALPLPAQAQGSGVTATVGAAVISLQSGPGLEFSSVGTAKLNDTFPVLGRARGSNRVWYEIKLPSGDTAWVSERVVNIDPSPDSLPWLGDNLAKTPWVMDCGRFRPILFVSAFAQVITNQAVILYKDIGIGKKQVGTVALNESVQVLDGPFCTLLSTDRYQIQWLVQNKAGVSGYMLESMPNGQSPFVKIATGVSPSDFPAVPTPSAAATSSGNSTDRPSSVTDQDIQAVMDIFSGVQRKTIDETQAQTQLQDVINGRDPSLLAWIVRRVPIYDGTSRGWYSFARYQDQTAMNFVTSDLDSDPVTTTINILFGKYKDSTQILQSLGCGG